jgi:hypothetical protein
VSQPRFEFRGDLASTPLPEVLQRVHHYRVPGVVTVSRGAAGKKIYIWDGDVIFASSTDREDSLGNFLLAKGRITREQFELSVEQLVASEGIRRHGAVLVAMEILTPRELFSLVTEQVRSIVYSVFEWDDGEVGFSVGQYATDEIIKLEIPTRQAILEGVKAIRDARRLASLLGPSWTVFDPVPDAIDIEDIGMSAAEVRMLRMVNGQRTLRDLVTLGPGDASHNAKLIYAFHALRLIARREMTGRTSVRKIQWKTGGSGFSPPGS